MLNSEDAGVRGKTPPPLNPLPPGEGRVHPGDYLPGS